MGRIEKTVFISYRRTNLPWALCIYQDLTMHGYDVFFDYQSIAGISKRSSSRISRHARIFWSFLPLPRWND